MRWVSLKFVKPRMRLAKTIFSSDGRILLAAGIELNERYIQRLRELGISGAYVEDGITDDILIEDIVSDKTRIEAMHSIRNIMEEIDIEKCVDEEAKERIKIDVARDTVSKILDDLSLNRELIVSLLDLRTYNDYTFAHSVNVTILSLVLGTALSLNELEIKDLGVGTLLHDIGMARIPKKIYLKSGPLTRGEYEIIKEHPKIGFELLKWNRDISLIAAHIAYQHHEKMNGSGYPRGLSGEKIHRFAQIVMVADVYDALTSDRNYRKRILPHEAVEYLMGGAGTFFSLKVVEAFVRHVAIYPVGVMVRLNSGERGVIAKINKPLLARPLIKIIYDKNGNLLKKSKIVDLSKEFTLSIVEVLEG